VQICWIHLSVRKFSFILALLIGALLAAELSARYVGFGHPLLYRAAGSSYEMAPGQHIARLGHTETVDSLGLRGSEVAARPTPGIARIMVLGDSVANGGSRLDDDQTISAITSRRLTAQGCRNEILNASAGGWSLFEEVAWAKRHGLYGAGTVVWVINAMDLDQASGTTAVLDHNPAFPSHAPGSALGEILFRYGLPRLGLGPDTADNGSIMPGAFDDAEFKQTLALTRAFAADLHRQGVNLIVLYHDGQGANPPRRQAAEQEFLVDLTNAGIAVTRTRPAGTAANPALFLDGIHPNAAGAAKIGDHLADYLRAYCGRQ
jgi:hypothetical protein